MSAGKTLSVRGLMGVACSFWQQVDTLNVLSVSVLAAEGHLVVGAGRCVVVWCWGCGWWLGLGMCLVVGASWGARVCGDRSV